MPNVVQVVIRGVDQWSGMLGKAGKDFAAFKNVAAGAVIAAGAALVSATAAAVALTAEAINTADATGQMAQKAGVAVEQFSALAYSARLAELSQEDLVKAAKAWSIEAAKGNSITGDFKEDILALADEFAGAADGANKVSRAVELFGKSGQDLIPLLNQGTAALREQMEEAEAFGLVIGRDFANNANQFNDNLDRLRASLEGLWLIVAREFLPILIEASEKLLVLARDYLPAVAANVKILAGLFENGLNPALAGTRLITDQIAKGFTNMVGQGLKGLSSLGGPAGPPEGIFDPKKSAEAEKLWNQMLETARKSSEDLSTIQTGLMAEEKRRYLERLDQISNLVQTEDQRRRLEFAAEEEHYGKLRQLDKAYNKSRLQLQSSYAQGVQTIFGNLAAVAQAFGKKGFAAFKAFRIAEALASTYAGAARALADYPYPFSLAIAASVVAAGLANVATIAASKPGGQAHGGLDFVGDSASYNLIRGERVLAPNQNQDLTQFLEQANGSRSVNINLNVDGTALGQVVGRLSRDGRLEIDPRSLV